MKYSGELLLKCIDEALIEYKELTSKGLKTPLQYVMNDHIREFIMITFSNLLQEEGVDHHSLYLLLNKLIK